MSGYDSWKLRSPDDERQDDEPPYYCTVFGHPNWMHCATHNWPQCPACERIEHEGDAA